MRDKMNFWAALCLSFTLTSLFVVYARSAGGTQTSQLRYYIALINEPDSTARSDGSGPVSPSGLFHSSGYVFGKQCRGVGNGGSQWQDVLLLKFRLAKPLPNEFKDMTPRVAYNATFYVHRDSTSGILRLNAVISLYHFKRKNQRGLQYDVTVFDTTCTVPPGHPVRLLTLQDGCPNRVALYVRLDESSATFSENLIPGFREILRKVRPANIPVNFYLRYEQRDSATGKVVRLLSAKQINFDPAKPFVFRFANPIPPELQAYPENWPEYRITGYLVPLEHSGDSLRCVLLLQQSLGHGGNMQVSTFTHRKLTLPNGDLVRIILRTPQMSASIPLPDRPKKYLRVRARNGFLKGIREELYVRAYF